MFSAELTKKSSRGKIGHCDFDTHMRDSKSVLWPTVEFRPLDIGGYVPRLFRISPAGFHKESSLGISAMSFWGDRMKSLCFRAWPDLAGWISGGTSLCFQDVRSWSWPEILFRHFGHCDFHMSGTNSVCVGP